MAFYCPENSPSDMQSNLNADLAAITSWLYDNKLTLYVAKSRLGLTKLNQLNDIALVANNDRLEKVTNFKNFGHGATTNQYLTWHDHIDQSQPCEEARGLKEI